MPPTILSGVHLDTSEVEGMLPYDKNCAAMAFSRVLGIGVYATLNFLISKRWIRRASELENTEKIETVIAGLALPACYEDKTWSIVKTGMKGKGDGRYFAINWGVNGNTGADAKGHAFAIVKKGGLGIVGNNAENTGASYNAEIRDHHKVSVYGPIT